MTPTLLFLCAASVALSIFAASGAPDGGGMSCTTIDFGVALAPVVFALAPLTGFSFQPWRAFAAGLAAASAGAVAVHLHCPNGTLEHIVPFHLLPIVVVGLVTVLVRRWLPTRSYAP